MAEFISQAEFARRRGVTRGFINKLVKQGKLPLHDRKLDFEECEKILSNLRDPRQPKPSKRKSKRKTVKKKAGKKATTRGKGKSEVPKVLPPIGESLQRKEYFKSVQEEIKTLELTKEVARVKEMQSAYFMAFRTLRDSLIEMGPRFSIAAAAESDPHTINQLYDKELRQVLKGLEKAPQVTEE